MLQQINKILVMVSSELIFLAKEFRKSFNFFRNKNLKGEKENGVKINKKKLRVI